jgi:hypothetical protein
MFVRIKSTPNSPRRSVQIVQARRVGTKVSQQIVRHVGVAMDEAEEQELVRLAEVIREKLEAERSDTLPLFPPETVTRRGTRAKTAKESKARPVDRVLLRDVVEEGRLVEGIQEVLGPLYDELGFSRILKGSQGAVLKDLVLARIADPQSKHRTAALLEQDFGVKLPLDRIYRMMDALYEERERAEDLVRESTFALVPGKVGVCFFDVTTLYFESVEEDTVRGFGYSKDQKFHQVQVVLALATTDHGLPIGYRLFHGSTADVSTLLACVEGWRTRFDIGSVVFVGDRAMMSEANLSAMEAAGCQYVVGASLRKLRGPIREKIFEPSGYRLASLESDPLWLREFEFEKGRRLIASFSARRARKDVSDRNRLLEKLGKRLGKAPRGKMKRLISNRGYLKYTQQDGSAGAQIDQAKVAEDAKWDGMYGVITNLPSTSDALEVLAQYRRLWTVEEAFRISKHDLKMRPIFHFKPERIEAHVALCFLAYALSRHAQHRVRLRKVDISVDVLRNELLRVQASILRDTKHGGRYRLPSAMSQLAKDIYAAFDVSRSLTPTPLH